MASSSAGRQLRSLLVVGAALPLLAVGLELASTARLATERAATECGLITRNVARQLDFLANDDVDAPLAELALDPRLQQVLDDAIAEAPSILQVSLCDTNGAVVATSPGMGRGEETRPHPPLPKIENLAQAFAVVWDLRAVDRVYLAESRVSQGTRPFASIRIQVAGTFLRDGVQSAFYRGVVGTLAFIGLVLAASWVLSRLAGTRLRDLEAGVSAMRAGRFDATIPESGADEFARLARELNLLGRQIHEEREKLGAEHTLYRAVDLLGDGILALGPRQEIILTNALACRWLGLPPHLSQGRRLESLLAAEHPLHALCGELRNGGEKSLSVRLTAVQDGELLVAVGHRIEAVEDPPGGLLIEIQRANEHLAMHSLIDQSKVLTVLGDMAAGFAHELRGRLQSIVFDLDAMVAAVADDPASAGEQGRAMSEKVRNLDRFISGFLRLSRLRPALVEPLRLEACVEEVCASLAADATLAGVEIEFQPAEGVPAVLADKAILCHALENVLRNAIQAQPSQNGRILVRTAYRQERAFISIADTGPGIPAENLQRVFDLFYTTRPEGSGVGLALVRQAVEMHGGQVEIASEPATGTEVTLSLPTSTGSVSSFMLSSPESVDAKPATAARLA